MSRSQTREKSQKNTAELSGYILEGVNYDRMTEESVVGVCMIEADAYGRTLHLVEPEHFFTEGPRAIYEAMQTMYREGWPIDIITVTDALRRKGVTHIEGNSAAYFVSRCITAVVSSAHLEAWCMILRQLYLEREMLRIRHTAGKGEGDAIEQAMEIQELLRKALSVKATDDWHDMSEVMISLHNHREAVKGKDMMGVSTGLATLDRLTYGLQPGQMIVIGARPSVGKSAFAGGLAVESAKKGAKVGIVSLEMPEEQLGARMASLYSDVEYWRIYRNRHKDEAEELRLADSMSSLAGLPIWMSDKTNVTGSAIRAKVEKLQKRKGLDLLIIDYLQLIEAEGKSSDLREREVAKLSRSLKVMAMDLKIPVVVLCQLNRDSEKGTGNKGVSKPKMSQIRESGSIEQDADVVILIHRDWKSGQTTDEHGNSTIDKANVILEKNRNGATADIPISFNPETMRFYEVDPFDLPSRAEHEYTQGLAAASRQLMAAQDQTDDIPF